MRSHYHTKLRTKKKRENYFYNFLLLSFAVIVEYHTFHPKGSIIIDISWRGISILIIVIINSSIKFCTIFLPILVLVKAIVMLKKT